MIEEKKSTILLVEDEENLHEALKLNLELEGYVVTSAFNGAAALKAVQSEYFDLIIMDVMIPEMDGINVTETIRLNNNEVPILILSARNSSADRVLGLKKGADDYLTKPFNLEELLLRVQKLINKNKKLLDKVAAVDPDRLALAQERMLEIEKGKPIEYSLKLGLDTALKEEYAHLDMSKVELKSNLY